MLKPAARCRPFLQDATFPPSTAGITPPPPEPATPADDTPASTGAGREAGDGATQPTEHLSVSAEEADRQSSPPAGDAAAPRELEGAREKCLEVLVLPPLCLGIRGGGMVEVVRSGFTGMLRHGALDDISHQCLVVICCS